MSWGTIHGQQGQGTPRIGYRGVAGDYTQGGIPAVTPLPPGPAQATPMGFGNIDQSQLDALISETEQTVSSAAAESSVASQTQEKVPFWQQVQQAFAPGTPGAEFAAQGLEAVQGYVQGAQNSLASLQAQLARKRAALASAKSPGKRARLQTEISLLQQKIMELSGAMQTGIAPPPPKPKPLGYILGGLGIAVVVGGLAYLLFGRK